MPSPTPFDLSGRCALVTGASSGLGAHFARTLFAAGAAVILAARRIDRLGALRAELAALGGRARSMILDVTDADAMPGALAEVEDQFAPVDILVNNAGVGLAQRFVDTSPEQWDAVVATNLLGVAHVARTVARSMIAAQRPGVIVNIGSIMGVRTGPGSAAYGATKAAVSHLTRGMAIELARHSIRVNALLPGFFATELMAEHDETWFTALARGVPQRRIGELTDLDGPLLLLTSPASAYMTGASVVVDGGHSVNSL